MNSTSLLRLCLVVLLGTFFRTCSGEAFFLPDIGLGPDPGPDPAAAQSGSNSVANSAANANTIGGNDGRLGPGFAANGDLAVSGEAHLGRPQTPLSPVDGPDNIITFPRPDTRPRQGPPPPSRPMPPPPQRDSCYHGGYPHPYMDQQQHREMHRKAIEEVMWEFVPLMQKNETSNMTSSTGPQSSTNQSSAIPRTLMSPVDPLSPKPTGPDSLESHKMSNMTSSSNQSSTSIYTRSLSPEDPHLATGPEGIQSPKMSNSSSSSNYSSSSPITQQV